MGLAGSDTVSLFGSGDTVQMSGASNIAQYASGFGAQTVAGFNTANGDKISLASSEFASIAALISGATTSGANTIINGTGGDTLTLVGISKASLVAADFALHS